MAFTKKNWLDRECEYPDRRLLNPTDGGAARSFTVERDEGLIYEEGDRFNAATMNDLELRIDAAAEEGAAALQAHRNDSGNPHRVSKSQVGLGNVDNAQQATKTEFNTHLANASNPHKVSKSQVGLGNVDNAQQATKTEFNTHANSKSNPHVVTASQAGALPIGGGTLTGELFTARRGIRWQNSPNSMWAFMGDGTLGGANFDFRCSGEGFLFRNMSGEELLPIYASNNSPASSARYKRNARVLRPGGLGGGGGCKEGADSVGDADSADGMGSANGAAVDALLHLPVYRYRYTAESGFDDGREHTGLMAEELAELDESLVYRNPDGAVEGVNYPAMVPHLLLLLQGAGAEIAALKQAVFGGGAVAQPGGGRDCEAARNGEAGGGALAAGVPNGGGGKAKAKACGGMRSPGGGEAHKKEGAAHG